MLPLLGRMAANAAAGARPALGRIASNVANRVSNGVTSLARGAGRVLSGLGGFLLGGRGRNNSPGQNDNDRQYDGSYAYGDRSVNEGRGNQLAVSGVQPTPVYGVGNEQRGNGGLTDSSVIAILRSIDSNIRALRSDMHHSNAQSEASMRPRSYPRPIRDMRGVGSSIGFGIGMLGVAANSILNGSGEAQAGTPGENQTPTPPETPSVVTPRENSAIAVPNNQTAEELQQDIGVAPAPDLSALPQAQTPEARQPYQNDISQLTSALNEISGQAREYMSRSRNPRHNTTIGASIRLAEGNLNALRQQYERGNPDAEVVAELRRQLLANIASIRNQIGGNITPQSQTREIPDASPAPDNNQTPGPQSSVMDDMVNVVSNPGIDYYTNDGDTNVQNIKNTYANYLMSALNAKDSPLQVNNNIDLIKRQILDVSEDNVARKLNAIQVANPVGQQGSGAPIIINNGGNDAAPAIIPVASGQNNTPAPSPGTGGILVAYKSHPMLANEPRSPAFFSHP